MGGRVGICAGVLLLVGLAGCSGGGDTGSNGAPAEGRDAASDRDAASRGRDAASTPDPDSPDGAVDGEDAAARDAGANGAEGDAASEDASVDAEVAPPASNCDAGQDCTDAGPGGCSSRPVVADIDGIRAGSDLLLVFDRSGSMADTWAGQMRWEAAGDAIVNAVSPHAEQLTLGALFFPSPDPDAPPMCIDPTGVTCTFIPTLVVQGGTCGVSPITEADQIDFASGTAFLAAFAPSGDPTPRYAPVPGGMTPLKEALQQAELAIADRSDPVSVVLVTDGDPNCEWDATVAMQIVGDWRARGIQTHVIGLPTLDAANATLDQLATAGGTSSMFAADAATLEEQLRGVVEGSLRREIASCRIEIEPFAGDDELHLIVTRAGLRYDVPRDLGADAGWSLSSDRSTVELAGALCAAAQAGRFDGLDVALGCVALPPLRDL